MGNADLGVGTERCERRAALDDASGCLTAQRRDGACHRESLGAVTYPGGQRVVAMNLYLYGDRAAETVARDTPVWQSWLQERFPMATELSQSE